MTAQPLATRSLRRRYAAIDDGRHARGVGILAGQGCDLAAPHPGDPINEDPGVHDNRRSSHV